MSAPLEAPGFADVWLPAALEEELRKPLGRTIADRPLVLGRTGDGGIFALDDRCPHRSAPLSAGSLVGPRRDRLRCAYHGWEFEVGAGGDAPCVRTPGVHADVPRASVGSYPARVDAGVAFVAFGDPPPRRPVEDSLDTFVMKSTVRAELADVLENLLDGTHTPHVHSGWLRDANRSQRFTGTLSVTDRHAEVRYAGERGQLGWVSRLLERGRTESFGRFVPPSTAEIEYRSARGIELRVEVHCAPDGDVVHAFSHVRTRRGALPPLLKRAVLEPVLRTIAAQDRAVVEAQRANWVRFGRPRHHVGHGDLLRPAIDHYFRTGTLPELGERTVEFDL